MTNEPFSERMRWLKRGMIIVTPRKTHLVLGKHSCLWDGYDEAPVVGVRVPYGVIRRVYTEGGVLCLCVI